MSYDDAEYNRRYLRGYNRQRRADRKRLGICVDCCAPATATRCTECAEIQAVKCVDRRLNAKLT